MTGAAVPPARLRQWVGVAVHGPREYAVGDSVWTEVKTLTEKRSALLAATQRGNEPLLPGAVALQGALAAVVWHGSETLQLAAAAQQSVLPAAAQCGDDPLAPTLQRSSAETRNHKAAERDVSGESARRRVVAARRRSATRLALDSGSGRDSEPLVPVTM
ncbi:hypothetical protein CYMTET_43426 [Cymbomonas tetramitiformis]|uniref:Uncharacterized protein n=1 Tax=Cymbomonas tetramitiformis TaxID=36881 RepID=A0AAE0C439_9CHLO|nr:hypothetical protein CYMTET_43426 [Cymbomonas tetramitiformis]